MAVRRTMRTCMGLNPAGGHEEMPSPASDENGAPVFWIDQDEERLLRPDWALTWDDNVRGWGRDIALKVKTAGKSYYGNADADVLSSLALESILAVLHTFFYSCRTAYNSKNKPQKQQEQRKLDKQVQTRKQQVSLSFLSCEKR
jgi:hypothetical protein